MRVRILSTSDVMLDINLAVMVSPEEMRVSYAFLREKVTFDGDGHPHTTIEAGTPQEVVFPVDELRSRRDWKSGSRFSLVFDRVAQAYVGIMNDTAESYSARRDPHAMVRTIPKDYITPIRLILPHEGADFSDIGIQVFQNSLPTFESNEEFALIESESIDLRRSLVRDFLPKLKVSGPDVIAVGELAHFTVEATRFNAPMSDPLVVHITATGGYLPKGSITLKDGTGTFAFRALDLGTGDTAELKIGLRYLASMARKSLEVV